MSETACTETGGFVTLLKHPGLVTISSYPLRYSTGKQRADIGCNGGEINE